MLGQELLARTKDTKKGDNLKPTHVSASQKGNVAAQNTVDNLDARQVEKLDEIRKNSKNDSATGSGLETLSSVAVGTYKNFDPGSLISGGKDLLSPVTAPVSGLVDSAIRAVT